MIYQACERNIDDIKNIKLLDTIISEREYLSHHAQLQNISFFDRIKFFIKMIK